MRPYGLIFGTKYGYEGLKIEGVRGRIICLFREY